MSKNLKENTLSSNLVFKGRFLKIHRDEVETPSGRKAVREYIKHPGASLVIPIMDDGKLVMVRQYRYATKSEYLEFPAGKIDLKEDIEDTARRELLEEVGFKCSRLEKLTHIHPVIGYSDEVIHIFLAYGLTYLGESPDHDEELETVLITVKELEDKIWRHEITDVKTQIAAFWLFRHIKTLE